MNSDWFRDLFKFPCSAMARRFRADHYGGPFLTAYRGRPWEDTQ